MALSDDDKKKALAAAAKSSSAKSTPTKSTPAPTKSAPAPSRPMPTMSGKPAYKTGGSNPLGTRKVGTTSMPTAKTKAVSPVMVKESPKMGKDPSGSANFNRTAPSRFTASAGPMNLNMGGKNAAPTGGRNLTGYEEKTQPSSNAKGSGSSVAPSTNAGAANNNAKQNIAANRNKNLAIGIGSSTVLGGVALSGAGKKIVEGGKKLVKYVGDTKERRAARKQQNADNKAFIAERKAAQEAKNPSTPVGKNSKISKSTMKKLKKK
jgi:hypothetical protein